MDRNYNATGWNEWLAFSGVMQDPSETAPEVRCEARVSPSIPEPFMERSPAMSAGSTDAPRRSILCHESFRRSNRPLRVQGALTLVASLCALLLTQGAALSDANEEPSYWLVAGPGVGLLESESDRMFSLGYSFTYAASAHLLSIRGTIGVNWLESDATDFGLLYGRQLIRRRSFLVSAGVGVGGFEYSEHHMRGLFHQEIETWSERSRGFGFPAEVQLFWRPSRHFGFGLYGFANFNNERHIGGVLFALQTGRWHR
jgi:hypothetical protein